MPAKSKKQQRLFGMVHACKKYGKCASNEVKKIANKISKKDAEDFAKTSHKSLPEKVEKANLYTLKNWISVNENRNRTGLKFGYPDGYYRFQYPGLYSVPTSATAALDLEIEEKMPRNKKETKNGIPRIKKNPNRMNTFSEGVDYSFKTWCETKKGEKMSNNECKCECSPCKGGDCQACDCKNCKCENCTCH